MAIRDEIKAKIEADFVSSLRKLLLRWGAELSADDYYEGYPECGSDIRMTVRIAGLYDADGTEYSPSVEVDLGSFMDGKDKPTPTQEAKP